MNQFTGVKAVASNISQGNEGVYTSEMFLADFPQFKSEETGACLAPNMILEMFIANANQSIPTSRWFEKWRYACGLYVAHHLTLYLRAYSDGSESVGQAAATGATIGLVASASLGDSEVSYDNKALTAATEKWGSLNATQYGQILATEARLVGMGGMYVI